MRQVVNLLKVIDERRYEDLSLQAKLHGLKVKPRMQALGMSVEEREEADSQALELFKSMQEAHKKVTNGR